ncbi:hypothetical protein BDV25DRAFT_136406 [Aspergillus avenaceus]|uniref:Uncharacterized protein n=1 Tax=Aspergillus avenaceus TaxID=36643 RepID=A0A5N6U617_ASPAV|nr:hypothetical protein BDV25DRAFT_136406 [Aspergillus avenaceus]
MAQNWPHNHSFQVVKMASSSRFIVPPPSKVRLTEKNVALHNAIEGLAEPKTIMSWMEKVIVDESTQAFYSELGLQYLDDKNDGEPLDFEESMDQLTEVASGAAINGLEYITKSLKLFSRKSEKACRATPLERFLTPDGNSDPVIFSRSALAFMGAGYGDLEGLEKRTQQMKENVGKVARNKLRKPKTN